MILGILMVCLQTTQGSACIPVPETTEFFPSIEECELAGQAVIEMFPEGYTAEVFCYETDFFEEV